MGARKWGLNFIKFQLWPSRTSHIWWTCQGVTMNALLFIYFFPTKIPTYCKFLCGDGSSGKDSILNFHSCNSTHELKITFLVAVMLSSSEQLKISVFLFTVPLTLALVLLASCCLLICSVLPHLPDILSCLSVYDFLLFYSFILLCYFKPWCWISSGISICF